MAKGATGVASRQAHRSAPGVVEDGGPPSHPRRPTTPLHCHTLECPDSTRAPLIAGTHTCESGGGGPGRLRSPRSKMGPSARSRAGRPMMGVLVGWEHEQQIGCLVVAMPHACLPAPTLLVTYPRVSDVARVLSGSRIGRGVGKQCPIGSPEDNRDAASSRLCVLGNMRTASSSAYAYALARIRVCMW